MALFSGLTGAELWIGVALSEWIGWRRFCGIFSGINTLTNLVSIYFSSSNIYESLYIFFSKNRRQVKILEVDKTGAWLYQNKLSDARFVFPRCDQSVKIDSRQLKLILKSVELVKKRSRI